METGFSYEMGGPTMTGKWYNPKTGDSFEVKDCFMVDNQMVVATKDGRMLDYNFTQDYIQGENNMVITPEMAKVNEPDKLLITQGIDLQDPGLNKQPPVNTSNQKLMEGLVPPAPAAPTVPIAPSVPTVPVVEQESENYSIIKKAFSKVKNPDIDLILNWPKFPMREVEMLYDVMGIDLDEIAEYCYKRFFDRDFKGIMVEKIRESIISKLEEEE